MLITLMSNLEVFWEDADGYLKFQWHEGNVFAHSEIFNWSKSVYVKAQAVWQVAKEELNKQGIEVIYVAIPANNTKLIKFEKMFGFQPITTHKDVLYMICSTEVE